MQELDGDQSTSKPEGCDYVAAPKITSFSCGLQPLQAEFLSDEGVSEIPFFKSKASWELQKKTLLIKEHVWHRTNRVRDV